jgi:hypothetical protein
VENPSLEFSKPLNKRMVAQTSEGSSMSVSNKAFDCLDFKNSKDLTTDNLMLIYQYSDSSRQAGSRK